MMRDTPLKTQPTTELCWDAMTGNSPFLPTVLLALPFSPLLGFWSKSYPYIRLLPQGIAMNHRNQ